MNNGGGDILSNWPFLHISDLCVLDLVSGHVAYRHVSLVDLNLHTKFRSNRKNLVDGRTYGYQT